MDVTMPTHCPAKGGPPGLAVYFAGVALLGLLGLLGLLATAAPPTVAGRAYAAPAVSASPVAAGVPLWTPPRPWPRQPSAAAREVVRFARPSDLAPAGDAVAADRFALPVAVALATCAVGVVALWRRTTASINRRPLLAPAPAVDVAMAAVLGAAEGRRPTTLRAVPDPLAVAEPPAEEEGVAFKPSVQTAAVTSAVDGFLAVRPVSINTPLGSKVTRTLPDGTVEAGVLLTVRDSTGCVLFPNATTAAIPVGTEVTVTGETFHVPAGLPSVGRVLGALAVPADGGPKVDPTAPGVVAAPLIQRSRNMDERKKIRRCLPTGVKLVDIIAPLGCGQFLLVIGEHGTGKTTLAMDAVLAQRDTGVLCVYAALTQAEGDAARVTARLQEAGAMAWTTVVTVGPGASTAERVGGLFTAFSMGEALRDAGRDVLLLIDDMTCLPDFWQDVVLMTRDPAADAGQPKGGPPEAMVQYEGMLVSAESAERRRLFSITIQRSAQLSDANGGGSLSVLGIAPAVAGAYQPGGLKRPPIDVSKYATLSEEMKAKLLAALERQQAPKASAETRGGKGGLSRETIEEFMSICDGQIFLEALREGEPGWNPSILMTQSRLGLDATSPALRQLQVAKIRLDLLQADDATSFSTNAAAKEAQRSRAALLGALLRQPAGQPLTHAQTVAAVFAVQNGYCAGLAPAALPPALATLLAALAADNTGLAAKLQRGEVLSAATQERLHALCRSALTPA
eukprot:EG_transcript_3018